jgi:hypothetical protein
MQRADHKLETAFLRPNMQLIKIDGNHARSCNQHFTHYTKQRPKIGAGLCSTNASVKKSMWFASHALRSQSSFACVCGCFSLVLSGSNEAT